MNIHRIISIAHKVNVAAALGVIYFIATTILEAAAR